MADDSDANSDIESGRKSPSDGAADNSKASTSRNPDKKLGHRRVGASGETTYKKIESRQIMCSIQLGIQHAVGCLASKPERDLLMQDFMTVETITFPSVGSNLTPAHQFHDFTFKTYAPIAFRYFRDLFHVKPQDFLCSMCTCPLRELSNPGASGSIFYLTVDDEFIIKTVQLKEGDFLQKLLPGYYMNLNQNPRTLLPKFFGLFCYHCNHKNIRLVAMNNLLPSTVKLHEKYDLKGSTYGRRANKKEKSKGSPTYKDLDFVEFHPEGLFLEADTFQALIKTFQRDCLVLESFKIMDYSLLVGIHNLDLAAREKADADDGDADDTEEDEPQSSNALSRSKSINRQRIVAHSTAMESIQAESEPIDQADDIPTGGIPARNAKGERLLLFIGIIDILQSYRIKKKLEHAFKALIHDGDTVSVHRPSFYSKRFQDFMTDKVFKKIPSLDLPEIKGNHRKFRNLVTSYIALKNSPSKRKSLSKLTRISDYEQGGDKGEDASPPESPCASLTSPVTAFSTLPSQSAVEPVANIVLSKPAKKTSPPKVSPASPIQIPPTYPAVLGRGAVGYQKNRVPPPVPPRGSPKVKSDSAPIRGFAHNFSGIPPSSTPPPAFEDAVRGDTPSKHRNPAPTRHLRDAISSSSDARFEHKSSLSVESWPPTGTTRGMPWTPPASVEGSTPTWTEGTPSFTESSSSCDIGNFSGCQTTPKRGSHSRRDSTEPKSLTDDSDHSIEMQTGHMRPQYLNTRGSPR